MPGRQQLQQTRQNLHHTAQEALHDRDDARNSPTHGSGSQPNLMTLPAKWTLAFVAALLLLLLLGLMSYRRLKQEDAAQRWVSHTHKVMEQLDLALATSLELDAKQGADGNANPQLSPRTWKSSGPIFRRSRHVYARGIPALQDHRHSTCGGRAVALGLHS